MNIDTIASAESIELSSDTNPQVTTGSDRQRSIAKGWRKVAYLSLAGVFFCLGVAGAVLPGLPATPFLLLTSYFLIRSSPRLNRKLLQSRFFGPILIDWQVRGGVRLHVKAQAIVVVVLTVAFSIYLCGYSVVPTAAIIALTAVGIVVIYRLPVASEKRSVLSSARPARDRVESP